VEGALLPLPAAAAVSTPCGGWRNLQSAPKKQRPALTQYRHGVEPGPPPPPPPLCISAVAVAVDRCSRRYTVTRTASTPLCSSSPISRVTGGDMMREDQSSSETWQTGDE
jgi:hypothetical protein